MRRRSGYLLIVTLLVTAALIFFASLLVGHQRSEGNLAVLAEHELIADEAARAGIQDAVYQLGQNAGWSAGFASEKLPKSGATYTMTFSGTGTYSTNNSAGAASKTGYGGRTVPAGVVHLVSVGTYGRAEVIQEALVGAKSGLFSHGLFGAQELDMSAKVYVDSYDSSQGSYDASNPGHNGDVGVNASSSGAVRMQNVEILGTVEVGPGGSESTTISKSGQPSYEGFSVMGAEKDMPAVSVPTGTSQGAVSVSNRDTVSLAPGTYTTLTMGSGAVLKLTPGDYVFTGAVDLNSQARIEVTTGVVNLYWTGDVVARGGSWLDNQTGQAANLIVYGGNSPQTWDLRGLSKNSMTYALYAPEADVEFGGGTEIYGSFVANTIAFDGNAKVHYDEALASLGGGGVQVRAAW